MRILHLPENVGSSISSLVAAEKELGFESELLTLYETRFNFSSDITYSLNNKPILRRLIGHISAFLKYRKGYDAYHFNFGSSLLNFPRQGFSLVDLPFYDSSAKKIFTYQGCDARQKYPTIERNKALKQNCAACFESDCYDGICNSGKRDLQRQKAIEKVEKYSDHIFALNPDLLYFLPPQKATFLPYANNESTFRRPKDLHFFQNDQIHIVHAPTQRAVKGTKYFLAAYEKLKDEFGNRLKLTLVEDVPHQEALNIYNSADLVVDQLLVGWYGSFALEVMSMGIPVATFIDENHTQFIPEQMAKDLPFLNINKNNVYVTLRNFILNRDMVYDLLSKTQHYVKKWHDPSKIAEITTAAYAGKEIPEL